MCDLSPEYIAWIPTNLGVLQRDVVITPQFQKIENERFRLQNDRYDTTDSIIKNPQIKFFVDFTIDFSSEQDGYWQFELTMYDREHGARIELLYACGKIYVNGKMIFSYRLSGAVDVESSKLDNVPNTVFTYVKRRIHLDLHHKEKVDNVIPVLPFSSREDFFQETYNSLAKKIKSIELDAKRIYRDQNTYLKYNAIESLYYDALGFYAYLQAFEKNFSSGDSTKLFHAESVLQSLEALNKKVQAEKAKDHMKAGMLTAAVTLFISLHIMSHNELFKATNYWVGTVIIFFIVLFFLEILHKLYSGIGLINIFFEPKLQAKELYQRVYIVGKSKGSYALPLRYKLLFWFLEYGVYMMIFIAIVLIMILMKLYPIS